MDEKLFREMCNLWKEEPVIKLIEKSVGYHLMKDRLKKIWKFIGGFKIMNIYNDFFMVKCERSQIGRKLCQKACGCYLAII